MRNWRIPFKSSSDYDRVTPSTKEAPGPAAPRTTATLGQDSIATSSTRPGSPDLLDKQMNKLDQGLSKGDGAGVFTFFRTLAHGAADIDKLDLYPKLTDRIERFPTVKQQVAAFCEVSKSFNKFSPNLGAQWPEGLEVQKNLQAVEARLRNEIPPGILSASLQKNFDEATLLGSKKS